VHKAQKTEKKPDIYNHTLADSPKESKSILTTLAVSPEPCRSSTGGVQVRWLKRLGCGMIISFFD